MDQDRWRKFFKENNWHVTWVKVMLSNGDHHFFSNHREWLFIKTLCDNLGTKVSEMELQFRSHLVKIDIDEESEGVYFVPSVMGMVGAETRNYFTVGVLKKGVVYKKMYLVPELVIEKEMADPISQCFEEALIYNEKTQENREE